MPTVPRHHDTSPLRPPATFPAHSGGGSPTLKPSLSTGPILAQKAFGRAGRGAGVVAIGLIAIGLIAISTASVIFGWNLTEDLRRKNVAEDNAVNTLLKGGFEAWEWGDAATASRQLKMAANSDRGRRLPTSLAVRWLDRRLHGEQVTILTQADGPPPPACIAASPDGRWLAAGGSDGLLRLLQNDTDGGHTSPPFSIHADSSINDVAFSADSRLVATVGADGVLRTWLPSSGGEQAEEWPSCDNTLLAVAFSPDGGRIAFGGVDRVVRVHPLAQGVGGKTAAVVERKSFELPGDPLAAATFEARGRIEAIRFLSNSELLVVCGNRAAVISAIDGTLVREFPPEVGTLSHLGMTLDRGRFVTAAPDAEAVTLWDLHLGKQLCRWEQPDCVQGCAISPDGSVVAAGCRNGQILLLDPSGLAPPRRLTGHTGTVVDVCFEPSGMLLSGGSDGTIRRWDPSRLPSMSGVWELQVPGNPLREVLALAAFSPPLKSSTKTVTPADGTVPSSTRAFGDSALSRPLLLVPVSGEPSVLDAVSGKTVPIEGAELLDGSRLFANPKSDRFLALSPRSRITIFPWPGAEGGPGAEPRSHALPQEALAAAWLPDGRVVTGGLDGILRTWSDDLTRSDDITDLGGAIAGISLAAVGTPRLAVVAQGQLIVCGVPRPESIGRFSCRTLVDDPRPTEKLTAVSWAPDGRRLAVGTVAGEVRVIDADSGSVVSTHPKHLGRIVSLLWSPEGKALVCADAEMVQLSEASTGARFDSIHPGWQIAGLTWADFSAEGSAGDQRVQGGLAGVVDRPSRSPVSLPTRPPSLLIFGGLADASAISNRRGRLAILELPVPSPR
ncbi:MAG: WD40 repeat domain-containing protein [Planctomycetota bacterium]|nr:MAG: WD40 repeat domain-containing protein [Planctomycetota bacterium]